MFELARRRWGDIDIWLTQSFGDSGGVPLVLMHTLILGEFNVSRTNCLQSSNILPLTGFVSMGGRSLGIAGPVLDLVTAGEITVGILGPSRCHNLGVVPRGMSASTMRSPSSLPPIASEMSDHVRIGKV